MVGIFGLGGARLVSGSSEDRPPTLFDHSHLPVSDANGKRVGWFDSTNPEEQIAVPLPSDANSVDAPGVSSVLVGIVRDASGQAVGLISGAGFIAGQIPDDRVLDPELVQKIVDYTIGNTGRGTLP